MSDTQEYKYENLKLYRLKVVDDIDTRIQRHPKGWFGQYTEETEIIVAARSEAEARQVASTTRYGPIVYNADLVFWKEPELSTCEEITVNHPMILLAQCGTG